MAGHAAASARQRQQCGGAARDADALARGAHPRRAPAHRRHRGPGPVRAPACGKTGDAGDRRHLVDGHRAIGHRRRRRRRGSDHGRPPPARAFAALSAGLENADFSAPAARQRRLLRTGQRRRKRVCRCGGPGRAGAARPERRTRSAAPAHRSLPGAGRGARRAWRVAAGPACAGPATAGGIAGADAERHRAGLARRRNHARVETHRQRPDAPEHQERKGLVCRQRRSADR